MVDTSTAEGGKLSSRFYIVRPEEVISWNERLLKLHGLTYDQLLQLISPNEVAVEFAARYSLISNSMKCKRCGQMMLLWSRNGLDGLQWRCMHVVTKQERRNGRKRNYCSSLSIRHGSIFHGHHLSIADIIEFMYLWAQNYKLHEIRLHTHFSSEMSVAWADYMRQIASGFVEASQTPIGGPGVVVEIGRLILYKTRIGEQHPYLIGMVERETENCIIIAIEDYTTERLKEKVLQWILHGTILISDEGTYIDGLNQLDYPIFITETYMERFELVNGQKLSVNNVLLQNICNEAKAKFLAMNGTCRAHFEGYIREFLFRRTFRNGDEFAGIILWAPLLHVP
uniref:DDE_Tnp_IS1595 domain-containing protein n=1 Tax=Elaeophora elaphi TaxID=1147741 RepID=A0A0R3S042_9BILA